MKPSLALGTRLGSGREEGSGGSGHAGVGAGTGANRRRRTSDKQGIDVSRSQGGVASSVEAEVARAEFASCLLPVSILSRYRATVWLKQR